MEIESINKLLLNKGITVTGFTHNTKASDYFVKVVFTHNDGNKWDAVVPYIYRRSNLNLSNEQEIADYLISIKPYFSQEAMESWRKQEWSKWEKLKKTTKKPEDLVTIDFFKVLLSFKEEIENFPDNPNPQRRFQDLKDQGYTISIYPIGNKKWGKMLLPIPLNAKMGYETFTHQFKSRVIRLFNGINAYEAKKTTPKSLIPDHKFSEIRWDENTKKTNPMDMTDEEIIEKFQLLDNQRNQQKREICRNCFQTGQRGHLFGIDFYPVGNAEWDKEIPTVGKAAEQGCIGCPWYDIEAWRKAINTLLKKEKWIR